MYPYIIFDVDGTLVDTRVAMMESYGVVCDAMNLYEDDLSHLFEYVGVRSVFIFREKHGLTGEKYEQAVERYYDYFLTEGLKKAILFDGVHLMLSDLKNKGCGLTVATARTIAALDIIFTKYDLFPYFSHIEAAPSRDIPGDKPAYIRACAQSMGQPASRCVMIGDRKFDIWGAQKVGAQSMGVTYGFGDRAEMEECKPDAIVSSIQELHHLLLRGNA